MSKVAIVTGSSRGLGAKISERLLAAGFIVPSCARGRMDVSDKASISRFVNDVLRDFGRIDVLVNNAAILGPVGPVEANPWDEWEETLRVNLLGPVCLTRAVLPSMKANRSGKIVNIAGGGATGPLSRRSAYASSKAALVRFTESVAQEVQPFGISVNAMLPGPMPTDMMHDIILAGPERLGETEFAEHSALSRSDDASINRAADLCSYLCSPESDGLTGKLISARYDRWPVRDISKVMASDLYTLRRRDENAS